MASLTADTVQNILEIISDWRGESSTNTDAKRIRAVSRAERDIARRGNFRVHLVKNQSIGTGDGTTVDFTIGTTIYPMRMKGLTELFINGTTEDKRVEVVDFTEYKLRYNSNNADRIAYEYYDQANDAWKVRLNPAPSSGSDITASWFFEPPKRTATTDTVIAPDINIIAHMALADLYKSEEEDDIRMDELQMAENLYKEFLGRENSPAQNQTYNMKTRERGIGER